YAHPGYGKRALLTQRLAIRAVLDIVEQGGALRLPVEHLARLERADPAVRREGGVRGDAPFLQRLRHRPALGLAAIAEQPADSLRHRAHAAFAILGIEQRARWRLLQNEQIKVRHIVDVDVRPDVLAGADMQRLA